MSFLRVDRRPRRGVILVIVVACLALFMTVGIAFVFYANQQAISMRFQRDASNGGRAANVNQFSRGNADEAPPQAVELFNLALGQLIYGAPDSDPDPTPGNQNVYRNFSAMNGHDLARAMYGYNSTTPAGNTTPYNGFGRVHTSGTDQYTQINYVYDGSTVVRRPEWETGNYIAKNAPYTYPDENNCYLAAIRPSDGKVLVPSFHRPWLNGSDFSAAQKSFLLRATSTDPNFKAPIANGDGSFGDVENLEGKITRQYDSMWMDLDAPVQTWRGRKYKALFAFLVVDADGRINVNTGHNGNKPSSSPSANYEQDSAQGWGPWEVGLNSVLLGQGASVVATGADKKLVRYGFRPENNYQLPSKVYSLDVQVTQAVPAGTGTPFYSNVDFDGSEVTNPPAMDGFHRVQLPTSYLTAPTFPSRYQNGGSGERNYHSLLYNPYLLQSSPRLTATSIGDRVFPVSELFFLNSKINGDSLNYNKSQLAALVTGLQSSILNDPLYSNPRFQITPISNDLQVPGWRPYKTASGPTYVQSVPTQLPMALDPSYETSPSVASAPPVGPNSEFDANWRSIVTALGPIDLNRKLTDYRTDPTKSYDADINGTPNGVGVNFAAAEADRVRLARDIFDRLAFATGARLDPTAALPDPAMPEFSALRRLAQIAVNIVDYIDSDDYMTPFVWNPLDPADAQAAANFAPANVSQRVVFGTELPRLVINEAITRWRNDPMDPFPKKNPLDPASPKIASLDYHVQTWVELHNPLTPPDTVNGDPNLSHQGAAPLVFKTQSVYRLVITKKQNLNLRDADNVDGHADTTLAATDKATVVNLGKDNSVVLWSDGTVGNGQPPTDSTLLDKTKNSCFHVIGPTDVPGNPADPTATSVVKVTYTAPEMDWTVPLVDGAPTPDAPTFLLQRLACPHKAFDANTNPYITVDYVDSKAARTKVWDSRQYDKNGPNANRDKNQGAIGRTQPYTAFLEFWKQQTPIVGAGNDNNIKETDDASQQGFDHSFYKHNSPISTPFEWLTHLDRSLISPVELFCVSAWKPHELTQQFFQGTFMAPVKHQHLANWNNYVTIGATNANFERLYRVLPLLDVRNRTLGMSFGGRIPGKVNVNTIWDDQTNMTKAPTLNALGDPQPANFFDTNDVRAFWQVMANQRSPMIGGTGAWVTTPTALTDKPFLPASTGHMSPSDAQFKGDGLSRTILDPTYLKATSGTNNHPYLQLDLLNKIYNNVTTRSNTFIVYCTIGYFEVTNNGPFNNTIPNRPILGKELGIEDGSNIRHKFFAVVDRTNLTIDTTNVSGRVLQGERPVFLSYEPTTTDLRRPDSNVATIRIPATGQTTITSGSVTAIAVQGMYDGQVWTITAGDTTGLKIPATKISIGIGPAQETVTVTGVSFLGSGIGADVTISTPTKSHHRGTIMQLNPQKSQLGNPGPQPNFNYKDPRYKPVVPFVAQIN